LKTSELNKSRPTINNDNHCAHLIHLYATTGINGSNP
jgi:hypothetical protein